MRRLRAPWLLVPFVLAHCGLDVVGAGVDSLAAPGEAGVPTADASGDASRPGDSATVGGDSAADTSTPPPAPVLRFLPDGTATVTAPSSTIDHTADGTADWSAWGYQASTTQHHKKIAKPLISDVVRTGVTISATGTNYAWPVNVKWSDGDGSLTSAQTTEFIYTEQEFKFTVAASPNRRKLTIHFGIYTARAQLTVTMNDTSVSALTTTMDHASPFTGQRIAIELASPVSGAFVTVDLLTVQALGASSGAVDLIAATLGDE